MKILSKLFNSLLRKDKSTEAATHQHLEEALKSHAVELERENARYEAILASIGDGMIAADENLIIIKINEQAEMMLGWKAEETIGKSLYDIVVTVDESGKEVPVDQRPTKLALLSGKKVVTTMTNNYYYIRKDQTRFPVAVTVSPIILHGKIIGTTNTFRDITKEKEIDRAKTEFISLASHQLRTPLSAIKWLIEVIMEGREGLTSEQRERLKDLFISNERLIILVNDLLSVSRIEVGKIVAKSQSVNLLQLINESIQILKPKADLKKEKINLAIETEVLEISLDPTLFREAFNNILDNAIAYTPEKLKITITLNKEGENYIISVHNPGIPIPELEKDKIFTKFYRGLSAQHMKPEGSGLGLYIAKSAIELNGGKVWFDSSPEKGVTFFISLPINPKIS